MKQNPKTIKQILNISFLSVSIPALILLLDADLLYYQQADSCGSVRYGNPAVAGYNSYGRSFETIGNSA